MRAVIQRVLKASVTIDNKVFSKIDKGLLVLLGVGTVDNEEDIQWLAKKIANMRLFPNEKGNLDLSVVDLNAEILVISQFTLFASTKKGNRPSFLNSAKPEVAEPLYEKFVSELQKLIDKPLKTGVFGADMKVDLLNDGPVTICMDTKNKE